MLVLGFGRRHSIVNLDGIHDKYVADDGNDELRDPVTVTEKKKLPVIVRVHTLYVYVICNVREIFHDGIEEITGRFGHGLKM